MKNTGLLLKNKRESVNLSISEIALATKINPKILNAIENGDETNLPAKTFLKGFIRSYATFLKMNVEEVLKTYHDETGGPAPVLVHEAYNPPPTPATPATRKSSVHQESSSGMRTAAIVVIVILIGLIIGVRELIEKYQREKVVESAENIKVSPLILPPAVVDPLKATEEAAAAPVPVPVPVATTGQPAAAPTVAAAPQPEVKEKVEEKKPDEKKPEEKKPEEKKVEVATEVKKLKNEIILEALDKIEVKFKINGESKKVSLGPTEVHTIHADQPVVFDFSDGGAVNIILNGRERGVPGDLGKPKSITIP